MSQPRRHPNPAAPARSRLERRAPHLLHRCANPSPDPNPNPNPNPNQVLGILTFLIIIATIVFASAIFYLEAS